MEKWEIELRLYLDKVLGKTKKTSKESKFFKKLALFLAVAIVFYGCIISYAYLASVKNSSNSYATMLLHHQVNILRQDVNTNSQDLNKLTKKVDLISDKVRLLGGLMNSNISIISRYHPDDYTYLNKDWTLDKLPSHITYDKSDLEFYKKYIKDETSIEYTKIF